jgi:hypothetical protein
VRQPHTGTAIYLGAQQKAKNSLFNEYARENFPRHFIYQKAGRRQKWEMSQKKLAEEKSLALAAHLKIFKGFNTRHAAFFVYSWPCISQWRRHTAEILQLSPRAHIFSKAQAA